MRAVWRVVDINGGCYTLYESPGKYVLHVCNPVQDFINGYDVEEVLLEEVLWVAEPVVSFDWTINGKRMGATLTITVPTVCNIRRMSGVAHGLVGRP